MKALTLYLASASPRRRELLQALGFEPQIVEHACDETMLDDEAPGALVRRLAGQKGRAALGRLATSEPPGVVIAADTSVVIGGDVLGKPADEQDALSMLRRLSGREHQVLTGLFVARTDVTRDVIALQVTRVRFRPLAEAVLRAYVASGEPLDKAGAYGIQGRGALFVESVDGSWSNVVGLPLERLAVSLEEIGVDLDEFMLGRLVSR